MILYFLNNENIKKPTYIKEKRFLLNKLDVYFCYERPKTLIILSLFSKDLKRL